MRIALGTEIDHVASWFATGEILFCHLALRITVNGSSSYRDFVCCDKKGYEEYFKTSDSHFSVHSSLIHWLRTPGAVGPYDLSSPMLISTAEIADHSGNVRLTCEPPKWHLTDRGGQAFPGAEAGAPKSEGQDAKNARRGKYRQILAKCFPNLIGHSLCSLGIARTAESSDESAPTPNSRDTTGYGLAIYYVQSAPTPDPNLSAKLIQSGLVHLSAELMRSIAEIDNEYRRVQGEVALKSDAFATTITSFPALQAAELEIRRLKSKIDRSMYGVACVLWNREFILEHKLDQKPWWNQAPGTVNLPDLKKALATIVSYGLGETHALTEAEAERILKSSTNALGQYAVQQIEEKKEKELCALLDSAVNIATGKPDASNVNEALLRLPIILSGCNDSSKATSSTYEAVLEVANGPSPLFPLALTYLSTVFLELREKKLLEEDKVWLASSSPTVFTYSFKPSRLFCFTRFQTMFSDADISFGRLGSLRSRIMEDCPKLFIDNINVSEDSSAKNILINVRLSASTDQLKGVGG